MAQKLKGSRSRALSVAVPTLVVTPEPWLREFLENLTDCLRPRPAEAIARGTAPGEFWPDVFVRSRLPWGRFAESAIFHTAFIALLWSFSHFSPQPTHLIERAARPRPEVLYYEASEYLQPLNSGDTKPKVTQKGDPAYSRQAIISVPKEPDHATQTIVALPPVKLNHDVPLPNVVAWNQPAPMVPLAATSSLRSRTPVTTTSVAAPAPEITSAHGDRSLPSPESVVSPAPDMNAIRGRRGSNAGPPSVIDPPPAVDSTTTRRLGDLNVGATQVVAPAPKLPVDAQLAPSRGLAGGSGSSAGAGSVVPPPPSVGGAGDGAGRLIALNLHPAAASGPVETPAGNRLGTFATTPEGKPGASGTPDIAGDVNGSSRDAGATGKSGWGPTGVPQGLQVGATPKASSAGNGNSGTPSFSQVAKATLPRNLALSPPAKTEGSAVAPTDEERRVFGVRKLYTMTLNTPNLNSGGGSWVMHFAEFKEDPQDKSQLIAPVAMQEVDPGYPLELMRKNVQGTVTLLAVIHTDGTVGEVSVLSGIDDQLDQYAREALGRWKFRPAEKNGKPVALQAMVKIPFKPTQRSGY
jgi:TonB family protein